jgi:HAD superfamily hydrolase (TIGR01484 family)
VKPPLLICTDLDRTLLPNGREPESPGVREILARLVSRDELDLVYVSGRDLRLALEAMEEYRLPRPRFVIGEVGTSVHAWTGEHWQSSAAWRERILAEWGGSRPGQLVDALAAIEGIELQEPAKQGPAKISFYFDQNADRARLEASITRVARDLGMSHRQVWSSAEVEGRAFLDILPRSASKLHAIEFLIETWHYEEARVLFAGDSGNDLEVLASGLRAVLVANADEEVRSQAVETATSLGHRDRLYLARGGFLGANGNYGAGILEGLAHFFPETVGWMRE